MLADGSGLAGLEEPGDRLNRMRLDGEDLGDHGLAPGEAVSNLLYQRLHFKSEIIL